MAFGAVEIPAFRRGRPARRHGGSPEVLDHPARAAILELVQREPGIPFLAILERLRLSPAFSSSLGNGSLVWHLARLERASILSSRRSGRARRYYPSAGPWHADLAACAFIQSTARWPVAQALVASTGVSLHELRECLPSTQDRTPAGLRIQLGLMREAGLLDAERRGRVFYYRATPKLRQAVQALAAAEARPVVVEATAWPSPVQLPARTVISADWA